MLKFEELLLEEERKLQAKDKAAKANPEFPAVRYRRTFLLFPRKLEGVRKWGFVTIEEHFYWSLSWPEDHSLCSGPIPSYGYTPVRFV